MRQSPQSVCLELSPMLIGDRPSAHADVRLVLNKTVVLNLSNKYETRRSKRLFRIVRKVGLENFASLHKNLKTVDSAERIAFKLLERQSSKSIVNRFALNAMVMASIVARTVNSKKCTLTVKDTRPQDASAGKPKASLSARRRLTRPLRRLFKPRRRHYIPMI